MDPVAQAKAIVKELKHYSEELHAKPRWLVLNKVDMLASEVREAQVKDFVKRLRWKGPVFVISALAREGLDALIRAVYDHVRLQRRPPEAEEDVRFEDPAQAVPAVPKPVLPRPPRRRRTAAVKPEVAGDDDA